MRKIDDITIAAIKRGFLAGETIATLAEKHGVSIGTIKRLKKSGEWDALRQAKAQVVRAAIEQMPSVTIAGVAIDFDRMLVDAIHSLSDDVARLPGKTRESAATALARLLELYRRYHPMSMDELIDLAIALPEFDPQEFAKRLRERYTQNQVNR